MSDKEHIVYSYTFSKDDAQYFGYTTKDRLEDRKKEHLNGEGENEVLQHRLRRPKDYPCDFGIVSEHETEDQARAEEGREIASAPKVINKTGASNSIYEEELEKIKKGLA